MPSGQNTYKDRLFNFIFGSEENKAWTLALYNAVNGSDYKDPSEIQINPVEREVQGRCPAAEDLLRGLPDQEDENQSG